LAGRGNADETARGIFRSLRRVLDIDPSPAESTHSLACDAAAIDVAVRGRSGASADHGLAALACRNFRTFLVLDDCLRGQVWIADFVQRSAGGARLGFCNGCSGHICAVAARSSRGDAGMDESRRALAALV